MLIAVLMQNPVVLQLEVINGIVLQDFSVDSRSHPFLTACFTYAEAVNNPRPSHYNHQRLLLV